MAPNVEPLFRKDSNIRSRLTSTSPSVRLLAVAILALAVAACGGRTPPAAADGDRLLVFAAASLKDAMDEAAAAWAADGQPTVQVSYAASSALARQIDQGAPADVFISADLAWMDWLDERGLIQAGGRQDLLGNDLVLVAPAGTASPLELAAGPDPVLARLGDGHVAMALVDAVPAGRYGREAFQALGLWGALAPRVAQADNVRAALMLVARGEAPLGVVYGSDARAEPRVRIVATFPAASHAPIVYPVAQVAASRHGNATAFIDWLASPEAGEIFRRHGFR